jgi:hypothetical protein
MGQSNNGCGIAGQSTDATGNPPGFIGEFTSQNAHGLKQSGSSLGQGLTSVIARAGCSH